jgi:YVTN family beta-propeller protein
MVIDTATNTLVATVPVPAGSVLRGVAVTPNGAFAYVANGGNNTVLVIDTTTNTIVATVPVGTLPLGVAITPNGAFAYVANAFSSTVSVIDTTNNTVIATVRVGPLPTGVAVTPDGAFAYVANADGNTVSVISTATNTVVATVGVGSFPQFIAFGTQDPIASLIAQVEALKPNQSAGLIAKLEQVRAKLDRGSSGAACNQLNAFINQVNASIKNGSLTPAQGQGLIGAVNALKSNLGCSRN